MDSNQIIYSMIFVCLGIMMLLLMAKPLKAIVRFLIGAGLGGVGFFAMNFLLQPFQIAVGINLLTMGFVGFLGLPGFAAMVFISALL